MQRVEERLSALGNVIACNDYVALVQSVFPSILSFSCFLADFHTTSMQSRRRSGDRRDHLRRAEIRSIPLDRRLKRPRWILLRHLQPGRPRPSKDLDTGPGRGRVEQPVAGAFGRTSTLRLLLARLWR